MKAVIFVLTLLGLMSVVAAVTGATNFYAVVPRHELLSQCIVAVYGGIALVAAFGCWKKNMLGWHFGAALIWITIAWGVFRAICVALTIGLPWLGLILGGLGEAIKIGVFGLVVLRFWKTLRREFHEPNHTQNPTPMSFTPPAADESCEPKA